MADQFLILTAAQAEQLSGPTASGSALWPVGLADGLRFVLPVAVLEDPAHEAHHADLALLPVAQVQPQDFSAIALPGA